MTRHSVNKVYVSSLMALGAECWRFPYKAEEKRSVYASSVSFCGWYSDHEPNRAFPFLVDILFSGISVLVWAYEEPRLWLYSLSYIQCFTELTSGPKMKLMTARPLVTRGSSEIPVQAGSRDVFGRWEIVCRCFSYPWLFLSALSRDYLY